MRHRPSNVIGFPGRRLTPSRPQGVASSTYLRVQEQLNQPPERWAGLNLPHVQFALGVCGLPVEEMAADLAKADPEVVDETMRELDEAWARLSALVHVLGVGRDRFAAARAEAHSGGL
jgi:hypothetical protein